MAAVIFVILFTAPRYLEITVKTEGDVKYVAATGKFVKKRPGGKPGACSNLAA